MSLSDEFLKNFDRRHCRKKNLKLQMQSREQGVSIDGKEIEFSTRFARFVHRRKKMCKAVFDQKIRKTWLTMLLFYSLYYHLNVPPSAYTCFCVVQIHMMLGALNHKFCLALRRIWFRIQKLQYNMLHKANQTQKCILP